MRADYHRPRRSPGAAASRAARDTHRATRRATARCRGRSPGSSATDPREPYAGVKPRLRHDRRLRILAVDRRRTIREQPDAPRRRIRFRIALLDVAEAAILALVPIVVAVTVRVLRYEPHA